jgi:hypothetical protein
MLHTAPKSKTCAYEPCGRPFIPFLPLQKVCGPVCAGRLVKAVKAKERELLRGRKEAIKPLAKWEAECRAIVQKIARIRDRNDGCISCQLPSTWGGQWHGSHFRSHGAASAVQFNLWNINKACSVCNLHKSGNIIEYRPRLIKKIGQAKVDWVMAQNQIVRYRVDYLKRFKSVMGKRLRRMEKWE